MFLVLIVFTFVKFEWVNANFIQRGRNGIGKIHFLIIHL